MQWTCFKLSIKKLKLHVMVASGKQKVREEYWCHQGFQNQVARKFIKTNAM